VLQSDPANRLLTQVEREICDLGAQWILAAALNTRGRSALIWDKPEEAQIPLREAAAILGRLHDTWRSGTRSHTWRTLPRFEVIQAGRLSSTEPPAFSWKNVSNFPVMQQFSDRRRTAAAEQLGANLLAVTHQRGPCPTHR
jgi:hypothetical protein